MVIWCVGRNYSEHAVEMKVEIPTEPLFFMKSGRCLEVAQEVITLPSWSEEIHHEAELLLVLGENLIPVAGAIALDLTARDKQVEAKAKGLPWSLAKAFKKSCPSSAFFPVAGFDSLNNLNIELKVNGELRQRSNTNSMIFKPETLINYLKNHFPIDVGDLILTGTPKGVGPLKDGDTVEASILGKITHNWVCKKA